MKETRMPPNTCSEFCRKQCQHHIWHWEYSVSKRTGLISYFNFQLSRYPCNSTIIQHFLSKCGHTYLTNIKTNCNQIVIIEEILGQWTGTMHALCLIWPVCSSLPFTTYVCVSELVWYWFNPLRPRHMDAISQTTFSNAFSWMKMQEFRLRFHWSLFRRFELIIF